MLPLVCPSCRGGLQHGPHTWRCTVCDRRFRSLRGIPVLRTIEDPYLPNDQDWEHARRLVEDFDRLDFPGLLGRYFDLATDLPEAIRRRQVAHILHAGERLEGWLDRLPVNEDHNGVVLDLGTGTGSYLEVLGRRGIEAVGVDIALRWLILARKRLDEAGMGHVALACGCAERLPLADGSVSAVVAGDVIEHVADQAATLAEAHRVLVPGGRLWMASPNRYSLAPEPHVGVWGVGFLPRRWMPAYVRWAGGPDFRAIRTLGYPGWRRLLQRSPFGGGRIEVPRLGAEDTGHPSRVRRVLARLHNHVVVNAAGQRLARAVGPLFHVECTRPLATPGEPAEPLAEAPGGDY